MKTAEIVLYQDERQGDQEVTVENMMGRLKQKRLKPAGFREMEYLIARPEKAPDILTDLPEDGLCVAILFCNVVFTHENGNEYIMALTRKGPTRLVAEKYWLADPLPSSFYVALLG